MILTCEASVPSLNLSIGAYIITDQELRRNLQARGLCLASKNHESSAVRKVFLGHLQSIIKPSVT